MPDVHVPKLHDHAGGRSIVKFVVEVAMIGVGVFLGLTGEQWRETRHQRELAQQALRRFKVEIEANRTAVTKVEDYHAKLFEQLRAATKMTPAERDSLHIKFEGTPYRRFIVRRIAWAGSRAA